MSRPGKPGIKRGDFTFSYIGEGGYNKAYYGDMKNRLVVFHLAKAIGNSDNYLDVEKAMDLPERSVRMCKLISPDLNAELFEDGWISDYIDDGDIPPTPKELRDFALDLYTKHHRVFVDITSPGNVKKRKSDGILIAIDVALALMLDSDEQAGDKKSQASLKFWEKKKVRYGKWFEERQRNYPYTQLAIRAIKALLWLQNFRPDIKDVSILKSNDELIEKLVTYYDKDTVSDEIKEFPINLKYFEKIETLQNVMKDARFDSTQKELICKLYLEKRFTIKHKDLLLFLVDELDLDFKVAVNIVKDQGIEDSRRIFAALDFLKKQNQLTKENASWLFGRLDLTNLFYVINNLFSADIALPANNYSP